MLSPEEYIAKRNAGTLAIGDAWFAPWYRGSVSTWYEAKWSEKREPIVVCMPGNVYFCIDSECGADRSGWEVTGEPPNLTVYPSINHYGIYHGWIRNGVITDDCEGRKYDSRVTSV